jgi:hypothetical protein
MFVISLSSGNRFAVNGPSDDFSDVFLDEGFGGED